MLPLLEYYLIVLAEFEPQLSVHFLVVYLATYFVLCQRGGPFLLFGSSCRFRDIRYQMVPIILLDKRSIFIGPTTKATFHTAYIAASVYVVEIIGPSKRHYGQLMSVGFGIGYMLSSPLAF